MPKPPQAQSEVTISYWGLFEPKSNYEELINEFQSNNPKIKVQYTQKGLKEYQQQLLARNGQPNGPDVFRYHNAWLPVVKKILATTPQSTIDNLNYDKTFYPAVIVDLAASPRGYYGIPLMYDGLGLYYNKKIFASKGLVAPPKEWDEIIETAKKLRVPQDGGKIQVAGLAMGSVKNIDHWGEILSLLMTQQSADIIHPDFTKDKTQGAIEFYIKMMTEHNLWSEDLENSTASFANEKVAMMFGVSWRAFEVQSINPNLDFAIAPVPQLPGTQVGISSYWVEGVSSGTTKEKQEASWKFLEFLASKQSQQKMYALQSSNRLFGEPYSRMDLSQDLSNNPYLGSILETAPSAYSTPLVDKTYDGSLNEELSNLYADHINSKKDDLVVLAEAIYVAINKYR
ncbi:MAG: extracellular solute-binding protein [bacterium]|nr:extracellular solute-binding protein [bacterium]